MQKGYSLEERIPLFAARCVNVCEAIPANRLKAGHFKDQLFRSATGVSSNYAEAEEPESRKDFIHKMKIAMKELSETRSWLRIIGASGYLKTEQLAPLIEESVALTRMMGASVATARRKLNEDGEAEL